MTKITKNAKTAAKPSAVVKSTKEFKTDTGAASSSPATEPTPTPPAKPSKQSEVIAMLSRAEGATLDEMVAATSWLPHTTRAMLTSLKKKGMWMGGTVPFGYQPVERRLVIVEDEAAIIRNAMRRYVELGSVRLLAEELKQQGMRTRATKQSGGRIRGGVPFGRGGLRHLLQNRLHLGEIVHKGVSYPGSHEAIVSTGLFEQVQQVMAEQTRERKHGTRAKQPSLLSQLVYDGHARSMAPSHAVKGGKRYRYYITHPRNIAVGDPPAWRMPAHDLEQGVIALLAKFLGDGNAVAAEMMADVDAQELVAKTERPERDGNELSSALPCDRRRLLLHCIERVDLKQDKLVLSVRVAENRTHALEATLHKLRRGNDVSLHISPDTSASAKPRDEQLVALLADARAVRLAVMSAPDRSLDELASMHRVGLGRFKRLIRISYLAPQIVQAVLDGEAGSDLTVARLNTVTNIPLCWIEQRDKFAA